MYTCQMESTVSVIHNFLGTNIGKIFEDACIFQSSVDKHIACVSSSESSNLSQS